MTQGRRRFLLPSAYSDLGSWPIPDIEIIRADKNFGPRRLAVEMYARGESSESIFKETGKSAKEVRRLVKKCIRLTGDGEIAGFYSLLEGWRAQNHVRRAPVVHALGSGSGGCTGALRQLFDRFPDIEEYIKSLFLKGRDGHSIHEARISYIDLHAEFKAKLIEAGLSDYDWPFNTFNIGYEALRRYCIGLLAANDSRWIAARSGEEAARRGKVGNGKMPIMPLLRGFGAVQLDFHRVDAASVILVENAFGVEHAIPVPRWYIGMLVEEKWGLVIGAYVTLELNPSADSVLETIETALRPLHFKKGDPRCAFMVDGKFLPNQFFPELAYQSFSVLKMDNAWSNAASEVVSNIVDTVGCAVNFGPVKAWWRRDLIERIFGKLTRKGLQRLPSTFGSGPGDPKRPHSPNYEAVRFRILLSELEAIIYGCIREHNEKRTDALHKASPNAALQAAMSHPASGFLHLPLPQATQEDLGLMAHVEEVTVRGSIKRGERPYVNIGRWRYTSPALAQSYDLINRSLIAYCDRRNVQIVKVTIKETGEQLGYLSPPQRWAGVEISFRERALINRIGYAAQLSENGLSTVRQWIHERTDEMVRKSSARKKNPRSSKEALAVARIVNRIGEEDADLSNRAETVRSDKNDVESSKTLPGVQHLPDTESERQISTPSSREALQPAPSFDPFGLNSIPEMFPIEKGE